MISPDKNLVYNTLYELEKEIMTTTAANRWLYHMVLALKDTYDIFPRDPRIIPCLKKFYLFYT